MTRPATIRSTLVVCALLLLVGTPVVTDAAPPAKRASRARVPRAASAAAAKAGVAPRAPRADSAAAAKPGAAARASRMPRTLDDVHIEGEIPVPQVLFITARDQRRYMDSQHHRYLKTSTRLGEDTPFPTWVAVIHGSPIDSRKETSR